MDSFFREMRKTVYAEVDPRVMGGEDSMNKIDQIIMDDENDGLNSMSCDSKDLLPP